MMQDFVTCDIENFMAAYLPFIPSKEDVTDCIETNLKPVGLMAQSELPVFTNFPASPAADDADIENSINRDIYDSLNSIADAIGTFSSSRRPRNRYRYNKIPRRTSISDVDSEFDNEVDACFVTDQALTTDDRRSSLGAAVWIGYIVSNTCEDRMKNNRKVVNAALRIMNCDVRRMFTFGITIEADEATLSYYSRSHCAVSRTFNFVQNPELLISVFMSFLFATESELGYDPMVQLQNDGRYIYQFPDGNQSSVFYRTVHIISGYPLSHITGRMCRIWLVEAYDPATKQAGAQAVLKDVCLDSGAKTEREIQNAIFEDIEAFFDSELSLDSPQLNDIKTQHRDLIDSGEYRQLFLEIILDYVGPISKPVVPSSEPKDHYRTPSEIVNRKRYRVLFKEVCRSVGDLETLGEAIDVIQQAHTALQLLYCAGWVHRDISIGNVLAHRTDDSLPWKVKLIDLEYAKRFPPDNYEAVVDPKTGTPYFMPTEILAKQYLYVPRKKVQTRDRSKYTKDANGLSRDIVIHNFQHDLESLWWLILYLIISHIKDQSTEDWQGPVFQNAVERCQNWAAPIFQNVIDLSSERRICFNYSLVEATVSFIPESVAPIAQLLEINRATLQHAFVGRVRDGYLRNVESYALVHLDFGDFLEAIQGLEKKEWRKYSLKTLTKFSTLNSNPRIPAFSPGAGACLSSPGNVKAKRGPEQNPNLEEQGRTEGSHKRGTKLKKVA
ncbi:hypothetical protein CVT25_006731 [Psilocybe cyanescens]|uniref:Protein kinase domain-containing protein n=1 Tax=Psilocybe cyanescens TaxID=93625 RepID=A0A409X473_PSICY|nr:hypothetical protein CVT25_006731 [Psilocybe cyanescens]